MHPHVPVGGYAFLARCHLDYQPRGIAWRPWLDALSSLAFGGDFRRLRDWWASETLGSGQAASRRATRPRGEQ